MTISRDNFKAFRNSKQHFLKVLGEFRNSKENCYQRVPAELDALLLLGDRLCCACDTRPEVSRGTRPVLNALSKGDLGVGELERWLKTLLWLSTPDVWPTITECLAPGLDEKCAFSMMNHALCLAAGVACEADWEAADAQVLETLSGYGPAAQHSGRRGTRFGWFFPLLNGTAS
jgi:hypothetical protein